MTLLPQSFTVYTQTSLTFDIRSGKTPKQWKKHESSPPGQEAAGPMDPMRCHKDSGEEAVGNV